MPVQNERRRRKPVRTRFGSLLADLGHHGKDLRAAAIPAGSQSETTARRKQLRREPAAVFKGAVEAGDDLCQPPEKRKIPAPMKTDTRVMGKMPSAVAHVKVHQEIEVRPAA